MMRLLEAWREQQTTTTYHDLSFDERFGLLVEHEYRKRQHDRRQRRLRQADLPHPHISTEAIDFALPRGLKKTQILQLAQGQWVTEALQVVVIGPTGIGKTFLSSAIAAQLCQAGHTVRYFKTAELLGELKLAKTDGSFPRLQKQLLATHLIILDEWLRDALAVNEAREILDFLDDRYRKRACLFASQLPVEQWHAQIQDPTLADAILDRIVHDAVRLTLKGESMRKLTSPIQRNDPTNN
ncbi:ATP-binding protein [filamentous cyanobacterium LEGE 11480]|uniref:ATP-binding protein n=1 Tax=Romeriopsis navalis LEGE 11480 TaxID=2777977 RepID=A0A928VRV8_9CYAN|nr:IS21-like element helper ATPase IstB [Romeriopsis navalis]MBE9033501.1 ATP-binding protein [Romeriopsis navalis LEGE 11480]